MADIPLTIQYPILSEAYFGNTVLQYFYALLIVLAALMAAKIVYFIFKKYVRAMAHKTETDLDDLLVKALEKPFIFLVLIIGLKLSAIPLSLASGAASLLNNLIGVLLTLDIAWLAVGGIDVAVEKILVPMTRKSRSKLDDQLVPFFRDGLKAVVFIIALLTIVANFGYDITAVLGGLGIAGIAVALAAQDSIGNIIGSAAIFTDRPFEIEHEVRIGDVSGNVEEVGMRSTRIRTLDNTLVTIPNSVVAKSAIENYTTTGRRKAYAKLSLEYSISNKKLKEAREMLLEIARGARGVDAEACTVRLSTFAESSLALTLAYDVVETSRFLDVQDEVNMQIKERFEKAGIEFAYPSRTLYVKD